MNAALLDRIFDDVTSARIAARDDGWRPVPLDGEWAEQQWVRGLRRIRLNAAGRGWCWSETS